jgi:hypothetical protein
MVNDLRGKDQGCGEQRTKSEKKNREKSKKNKD